MHLSIFMGIKKKTVVSSLFFGPSRNRWDILYSKPGGTKETAWCGMGFNKDKPAMDGAATWLPR